jgi:ABC-type phosphate transport system permease subunit
LINWWWGIWILGGVLVFLGPSARTDLFTTYSTNALRTDRVGIWSTEFGLAALVAAAVLAIVLVRRVTSLQDDSFKAVPAWQPAPQPEAQPPG